MKPTDVLLLAFLVAAPSIANAAQQEPERQQPLQELVRTEVVYPQDKGELQLTVGSLFDSGRAFDTFAVPVSLEYGLTDAWQLGLDWGAFTHVGFPGDAISTTGDLAFDTRYSFMNIGGSRMHAALGVEVGFPRHVESQAERRRGREVEPYVAFAADLTQRGVQVFAHGGLALAAPEDGDGGVDRELQWNAGALIPLGSMTLATEFNVRNDTVTLRGARELYVTPSIAFRPRQAWEIGIGIPLGLTPESSRLGLALRMTYER